MVLFSLPSIGFVLYLLFGQNYTRQKMFVVKREEDRRFLQEVFLEQYREFADPHYRFSTPEAEEFRETILLLLQNNRAFLTEKNQVDLYTRGKDKFDALFAAIREARHHIHLEYFVINNDELGRAVVHALAEKAREGVEVRLLFDAMGTRAGGGSRKAFSELTDAGGEIGVFFPSVYRVNYRNHRKIAVIDGTVGFIGGFNIGDDYLGKGPLGPWRDTAFRITGGLSSSPAPVLPRLALRDRRVPGPGPRSHTSLTPATAGRHRSRSSPAARIPGGTRSRRATSN